MKDFRNSQERIQFTKDEFGEHTLDPNGVHYEDESDAVMHLLVGCTGGFRDDVFEFVVSVLRDVGTKQEDVLMSIAEVVKADPRIAAEFIANVLCHGNLLESAGFVYWTTPRGEQWIDISDAGGVA